MTGLMLAPPEHHHHVDSPADLAELLATGRARIVVLDSVNPHGGRGGSLDSSQAAWLVRELAATSDLEVVVATRHRSRDLFNARTPDGSSPRILGPELLSILLAHRCVVGWVGGYRHRPSAVRHGDAWHGLWEATPAAVGLLRRVMRGSAPRRGESTVPSIRPDFRTA